MRKPVLLALSLAFLVSAQSALGSPQKTEKIVR
nr:hypothetical protein [uncultured bacterium]